VSGKENTVTDALSWLNINTLDTTTSIDFNRLTKMHQGDEEHQHLRVRSTSLKFSEVPLIISEGTIVCDLSTGTSRPCEFRRAVFDALHNLSHPGIRATQYLVVTQRFDWCAINCDVRNWSRACLQCQRVKMHCHMAPLGTFASPEIRFHHVHID